MGTPDPIGSVPCCLCWGERLLPEVLWVSASLLSSFGVPRSSLDLVGVQ